MPNQRTSEVLHKVNMAISWGRPDNESIGLSPQGFVEILIEARDEIKRLVAEKEGCVIDLEHQDSGAYDFGYKPK